MKKMNQQRGFTLVEMSIVLVIIGLILGAVSIGKDLQRDAEYSKIAQKFIAGWVSAYQAYYQRTGVVIGDKVEAPTLKVDGITATPALMCGTASTQAGATKTLLTLMGSLGIEVPPGKKQGEESTYVYLDGAGVPHKLEVCFKHNASGTKSGSGNVMVIFDVTLPLAKALDSKIDGRLSGSEGIVREDATTPAVIWAGTDGTATIHYKMTQ